MFSSKVAKLSALKALKALKLGKVAGLGGVTLLGKKKKALAVAKTLKGLSALSFVGR